MIKQFLPAIAFTFLLSSCSTFKPLNFTSNRQIATANAITLQSKFIDDISVTAPVITDKTTVIKAEPQSKESVKTSGKSTTSASGESAKSKEAAEKAESDMLALLMASRKAKPEVEEASAVQLKYSVLLKTEVESLPSKKLLDNVDSWYGVRYITGGNTKKGVDCSGFTVAVYADIYGIALPRVSREQYRISRKISTTELEEGDLVFFNTKGNGVSHVGIYLGNNKFIHATVHKGIMVSDLYESYYVKRYYGSGRIDEKRIVSN
jgi:cell wall-associated NlpC family hydrolase